MIELACIDGRSSIAHSVFLHPDEDHFLDPYIRKVVRMDPEALLRIAQLQNEQLSFGLNHRLMTISGISTLIYLGEL
jgi:hypothetical protein